MLRFFLPLIITFPLWFRIAVLLRAQDSWSKWLIEHTPWWLGLRLTTIICVNCGYSYTDWDPPKLVEKCPKCKV